jgi:hypothetical protein
MAPHRCTTILDELFSEWRHSTGPQAGLCTLTGTLDAQNDGQKAREVYRLSMQLPSVMLWGQTDERHAHEQVDHLFLVAG